MPHPGEQMARRTHVFGKRAALFCIRFYRVAGSPWLGGACRFTPSCSAYALEAVEQYGALHGLRLAVGRLLRCHPFHRGAGFDPVPSPVRESQT